MSDMNAFLSSLTEEQKQKLLAALIGDRKEEKAEELNKEETVIDENFIVQKSSNSNQRRREPVKARKNEFVDTGELHRDIETPQYEKTPRRRPPPKKLDVECGVCGRSFKADQRYVYGEFYRCNKCTGR